MLVVWLHDSPTTVAALVGNAGSVPLIVDALTDRQGAKDDCVQGVCVCVCVFACMWS